MRRDIRRVRAQNAVNIETPAPQTSETPTLGGSLNLLSYPNMYALINRTTSVGVFVSFRAIVILGGILALVATIGCGDNPPPASAATPIVVRTAVVVERMVVTATPAPPTATPMPRPTPVPPPCLPAQVKKIREGKTPASPCALPTRPPRPETPTPLPTATPAPVAAAPTPRPTPELSVCVLPAQLEMAAIGKKVSCVTPTPPPGTTPTPLPTEAEKQFCLKAAADIQLLLRGEHPKQNEFAVFGMNKFSEVIHARPVAGPNRCFGVVTVKGRRNTRIVFSDDWFENWNEAEHGSWQ